MFIPSIRFSIFFAKSYCKVKSDAKVTRVDILKFRAQKENTVMLLNQKHFHKVLQMICQAMVFVKVF